MGGGHHIRAVVVSAPITKSSTQLHHFRVARDHDRRGLAHTG